ncbi:type II toxin-antitoxin system TacA family antitoxin [Xanthobacter autotrophicus]|uniref:type II toxin-antitoxin system TacA family antitoxin n=1 Tax=Xanthobacter autotrophicus TaxID=280 RepID=UPI003726CB02
MTSSHAFNRIDIVDTFCHIALMTKVRTSPAERLRPATIAVAERPLSSETKGSINLRIESHTRQLIDDAAAILGKTRTEFMIDSARSLAIDVLLDQRLFVLDSDRYDAFIHALDNPPAPGPKLRALLRRVPAWET